ncbi:DNA polymerase I [Spiroplasma sp. TIUS-1]|uniref:DNA polymerase I n=1 Tax=Spiroplasma sp. TIUS-1 TaxID=216963 RepID=UPI001397DEBB|nr:DNA polymerase I [Spiroplasma sp. TIUS-1]QHX36099.1 DNA polymerase I [Spiroplasma sp. TIUS-1]
MKKILLVDGNGLLYRAFHSSSYSQMKTSQGIPTNAVFTFINMLMNFINKGEYHNTVVLLDKGKQTFRHDKLESYKAGRKETPDDLKPQFAIVREFLKSSNIDHFEMSNYEADDLIGSLATKYCKDFKIEIFSNDKDMYQLVNENTCVIKQKNKETIIVDEKYLMEEMKLTPSQIIHYKGLCGDGSDNIKGVEGVGDKKATELLNEYGTIENIYANIENIKGKLNEKLIAGKESAFLSKDVATIKCDIEIPEYKNNEFNLDQDGLKSFLEKFEMKTLLKKYSFNEYTKLVIEPVTKIELNHQEIESWTSKYAQDENYIYLETLNDNYHDSPMIGVGIVNNTGGYFLDLEKAKNKEINIFNWQEGSFTIDENFQGFLLNSKFKTYDIKKTIYVLNKLGYKTKNENFIYDAMIAGYVLDANIKPNIFALNEKFTTNEIKNTEDVFGKGVKRSTMIEQSVKAEYMIECANVIRESENEIISLLKDKDQLMLYENIDLPFCFVLLEMEQNGVKIDKKELLIQTKATEEKIKNIESQIFAITDKVIGEKFNPGSPKQVSELLFNKLGLPNTSKGSTGKEALDVLYNAHEIVPLILQHRKYSKLYSTYLVGFEKYIEDDNRVRSIFNQTLTNTGRLSSSYPNLQNISVRDADQRQFRKIFVTDDNKIFMSFDYSQIELRVLAEVANEETLLNIFAKDGDIHTEAAKMIFNTKEVSSDQRRIAKIFNFGILYGLSDFGLAKDLNISIPEAKQFIKNYYNTFSDIQSFKIGTLEEANAEGYVKMVSNRRRYIAELSSSNRMIKSFGERAAINAPIQGVAADILKVAMNEIFAKKLNIKFVGQIHDEVILELHENDFDEISKIVKLTMEEAFATLFAKLNINKKPKVKVEVKGSRGKTWFDLK